MSPERPPRVAFDLRTLLAILHEHRVDYTVIGGVAVQVHGHRRTTKDLDVVAGPDRQNLERLAAALAQLRARPRDLPGGGAPDADHLAAAPIVPPLTTEHGELHILRDVPGAPAYAELRARALVIDLDGIAVAVAGLDDLISMKRASGRPADERDIAALVADAGAGAPGA
jgi:predicted nucleotidyltransferase